MASQKRLVVEQGLVCHPSGLSHIVAVAVSAALQRGRNVLTYRFIGDVQMAPLAESKRTDDLWQHTCFELFVWPVGGSGYYEFNFAPSTEWAAYSFQGYRAGMADLAIPAPVIERLSDGVRVTIDLSGLPDGKWRVGISAVIEEPDGTISYWALAHPEAKADFHDPACFALTV